MDKVWTLAGGVIEQWETDWMYQRVYRYALTYLYGWLTGKTVRSVT